MKALSFLTFSLLPVLLAEASGLPPRVSALLPIVVESDAAKHGERYAGTTVENVTISTKRYEHSIDWPLGVEGSKFLDWKNFKANGVNLGAWLAPEKGAFADWWNQYSPNSTDEWGMCEDLGAKKCAEVLNMHYKTFITTDTVDTLAKTGVNTLRITTTYAAWVDVPGSKLYHGTQQGFLRLIALYAIEKYKMHVIIDLHGLPGGVNGLDIGEAVGHFGWFGNQTNLLYSWAAFDSVLSFIQETGHINAFTIAPINEPCDNVTGIFSSYALTDDGVNWVNTYIKGCLKLISMVDRRIPLMFMDGYMGEEFWTPFYSTDANMVFDRHVYYFAVPGATPDLAIAAACNIAMAMPGDGKFPVFIGEWTTAVATNNSLAERNSIFETQRYAWQQWVSGGAFWTAVDKSSTSVDGEGVMSDYWDFTQLVHAKVAVYETTQSYC